MPTPDKYDAVAAKYEAELRVMTLAEEDRQYNRELIAEAIREALATATGPLHKCHVCGKEDDARHLLDVKGNFPGGCKVTCLECVGRLAVKEEAAKVADAKVNDQRIIAEQEAEDKDVGDPELFDHGATVAESIAAAIRSLP